MCIHLWHASDSGTLQSTYEWFRLPLLPPLSVNPGLVLGDPVLFWLWLPLLFAYFPNTFLNSFPLSFPFVRLEDCPREWCFKLCSLHRHWLVFTLRAVFSSRTSYKLSVKLLLTLPLLASGLLANSVILVCYLLSYHFTVILPNACFSCSDFTSLHPPAHTVQSYLFLMVLTIQILAS